MKKCPFCAEEIQDEAIKCRYCQSFLSAAPAPVADPKPAPAPAPVKTPGGGPVLLVPEVKSSASQKGRGESEAEGEDNGGYRRKVLYSGSPSWRAFFKEYALLVLAALMIPFITLWIAGQLEASLFTRTLAVLIPLGLAAFGFAAITVYRKSKVFRVSTTSIEFEYGLLSKKIDVLELWRCRDVRYQQSLLDRILAIAHIEIYTADVTTPHLCIEGLPASRQLFEKIRDSIEIQRQSRNVVGFVE